MGVDPRRRADGSLVGELDPLERPDADRYRPQSMVAVPLNMGERDLARRAVRELIEREGTSLAARTLLELLERAPSVELIRRALALGGLQNDH